MSAPRTRDNSAIATSRSRAGLRASLCDRVDVGGTEGTREPRPGSAEIIISFGGEIFAPRSRAGEPLSTRAARNRGAHFLPPFFAAAFLGPFCAATAARRSATRSQNSTRGFALSYSASGTKQKAASTLSPMV